MDPTEDWGFQKEALQSEVTPDADFINQTFNQIILTSGWHQMNNTVPDATVCDLFGEARFPALIMYCLHRGGGESRSRGEAQREQVQTGLTNAIIF